MISTLYLIQLVAFQLWYLTSKQIRPAPDTGYALRVVQQPKQSRLVGSALFLSTTVIFVLMLGLMSGICASLVGLMGVGCLTVSLQPFNYLRLSTVGFLYALSLILELFI